MKAIMKRDAATMSEEEPCVSSPSKKKTKTMAERLIENEPYNLFFTEISDLPETHNQKNSITFTDLLCPSLGELKCSLQFNYLVDMAWLEQQYTTAGQSGKPVLVFYGKDITPPENAGRSTFIRKVEVRMRDQFGTHHSKVGIYVYNDDSIRVVISTANLFFEDWSRYCQGLWISPLCPALPESSTDEDGESPTNFKSDLIDYLKTYGPELMRTWINYVKRADFSNVKVFLITSAPGNHSHDSKFCHLQIMERLLSEHCTLPAHCSLWSIIAQLSSISSLGNDEAQWLNGSLLNSLTKHNNCNLQNNCDAAISVIYPTKDNVRNSYYGPGGGDCLSFSEANYKKQAWLKRYLHQWKADTAHRSRAVPHIKTYCRVSQDNDKLAWFLLTSANLSKAAWGNTFTRRGTRYVRSYEVGVLFFPKYFDEEYFQIRDIDDDGTARLFPFIFDLPLTPYGDTDEPDCRVYE